MGDWEIHAFSVLCRSTRIFSAFTVTYCTINLSRDVIQLLLKGILPKGSSKFDYASEAVESSLAVAISERLEHRPAHSSLVVVCIGTDRSTGDALGPLTGSYLATKAPDVRLYGTLEHPVHAVNLSETLARIESDVPHPFVIAVDACLGQLSTVGQITLGDGPLRPGAGVHKKLPPVGDVHITGIVNVGGFMEYFVLQNTRLHIVVRMSEVIAQSLALAVAPPVSQATDSGSSLAPRMDNRPYRFGDRIRQRF
ncbi:MAG: spore protease YyaC [Firmicutes bacterium]|nr:spore protease YyaC [Bacillota bacterium]